MKIGQAYKILDNIDSDEYTVDEKALAIRKILWAIMARGDVVAAASVDTKFLALAIMIAGALAGGDGK